MRVLRTKRELRCPKPNRASSPSLPPRPHSQGIRGTAVALGSRGRSRDLRGREAGDWKHVSKSTTAKNKSPFKKCELVHKINKHHPLFPFHSSISVPFTFPKWAMSVVSYCCETLYLMGHTGKNTFVTLYLMGMWQFSRDGGVGWCQLWVRMCEAGPWVIFFRWPFINVNKFSFNTFLWKRDMQKRHEQSVNRLYGFAKLELKVIGKSSKSKGHPKKSHSSKKALAITKRMRF